MRWDGPSKREKQRVSIWQKYGNGYQRSVYSRCRSRQSIVRLFWSRQPLILLLEGMTCASCALRIEKGLKKVIGVTSASVNLATERAAVSYDPTVASPADLVTAVARAGYSAEEVTPTGQEIAIDTHRQACCS